MAGWLLALHAFVWGGFILTRLLFRAEKRENAVTSRETHQAAGSDLGLLAHCAGFGILYFGILFGGDPWFAPESGLGTALILAGMALMLWTLRSFHSWRLAARIEQGHQLATHGPFRLIRHPIYAGLDLLALGSAFWLPTPVVWLGFIGVLIGGDVRARVEEKLLARAFGSAYEGYCRQTRRLIPGVY